MNSSSATLDFSAYITNHTKDFTGREWVFKIIDDWPADPKGPQFFILTGEPGVGKSAIAARLTQIRELAAYHFCIARQADTIDPLNFARSISQQLCRFDGFARGILKDSGITVTTEQNIRENYGEAIGVKIESLVLNAPSASVAFTHSVLEPLKALCGGAGDEEIEDKNSPLLILVDSLDEAAQHTGRETIVDLLANAGTVPAQVRFVLTSRPEGAFLDQFEHLEIPFHMLDAGAEENAADVRDYLDQQVEDSAISADLQVRLAASNMAQQTFVESLGEASGGNFLYLSFLLPSIASGAQPLDRLEDLPQGLDGVYREFLRTRTVGKDRREWRSLYRPLLGALAAAQAPLSRAQLLQFTGLGEQDLDDGLQDVGQFLDPAGTREEQYHLYHQSLPDFLGDKERAREFWIDLAAVHTRIAESYWSRYHDDWCECDEYGLRHLALHLSHAGRLCKRKLYELINPHWRRLKLNRLKSDQSFMQDVQWALEVARHEEDDSLTRYISLSLMAGSIATKSNDVIAETLGAMVALGEPERADAYLQTMSEPGVRAGAMLQMARAYWQLHHRRGEQSDAQHARRYFEDALREGSVAFKIVTNPKALIDDLRNLGLVDEAIAVADLFHEEGRMDWVWRDTLHGCRAELARFAVEAHPDRVQYWRSQYPGSFGKIVGAAAMHLAEELFRQGDLKNSDTQLRLVEDLARQEGWALSERADSGLVGFEGDGSEPWWPMLVLRAQIGPIERLFELIDEIEHRMKTYKFSSWGGRVAFSAAQGEVALQWALASHGDSALSEAAGRMLDRVIAYCERVGYIEEDIDAWKKELAWWLGVIGQMTTSLAIQQTLVWQRGNGQIRDGTRVWEQETPHSILFGLLENLSGQVPPRFPSQGELDDSTVTVGTQEYVDSGVSMVRSLIRGMELDKEAFDPGEARQALEAALARVVAGEWESTRNLWFGRSLGVLLVGRALYRLALQDRKLAAGFLEGYFDSARKNGRHACWVQLVAAAPTLELLRPGLWPDLWKLLEPIELWHRQGAPRKEEE